MGPQRLDTLFEAVEDLLVDRKLFGEQKTTSYWPLLNRNIHLWVCSHFVNSPENNYLLKCAQDSDLSALGLVFLYATMKDKMRWWETEGQMSPPRNPAELTQDVMDLMKVRQQQSTDLLSSVSSSQTCRSSILNALYMLLQPHLISQLRLNKALVRAHPEPLPVHCYLKHLFLWWAWEYWRENAGGSSTYVSQALLVSRWIRPWLNDVCDHLRHLREGQSATKVGQFEEWQPL